ncbi:glycosyltransferase family 2 protein [Paraglaciecola chathamensis]|uniref:glycosyltransferase family 2 protein n=1 Tax=Paraglaciecola chathamensis TaxID=368405 RepID=UPI0026F510E5|nr:glycosyltransferase family A protein [Paraglaciecola chathamensis]MDO6558196.1 glycosyltransferase family A protein [Paraglaciecola chathamensis]
MNKITVLMPVFNSEMYISQAISSILAQTFQNFCFYILDDGSTDASVKIIKRFMHADPRIKFFSNKENLGILKSRQTLIDLVETEFFAWMDSDDIATPERLQLQLERILEKNEYGGVSGAMKIINTQSVHKPPLNSEMVKAQLFVQNVMSNMAMIRTSALKKSGFSFATFSSKSASDYGMWAALSEVSTLTNLPFITNYYRHHTGQESQANAHYQRLSAKEICANNFKKLGIDIPNHLVTCIRLFPQDRVSKSEAKQILSLYLAAIEINNRIEKYHPAHFRTVLADSYRRHCRAFGLLGIFLFIKHFGISQFLKGHKYGWSFTLYCWNHYSREK